MPGFTYFQCLNIDKNDQLDLTNLDIHQFSLVFSN